MPELKEGKLTSEHEAMKSAGIWGIVAMLLGFLTTAGAEVMGRIFEVDSTAGIIAGSVVTLAGLALKMFTKLGYIKGRSNLKIASEKPGDE